MEQPLQEEYGPEGCLVSTRHRPEVSRFLYLALRVRMMVLSRKVGEHVTHRTIVLEAHALTKTYGEGELRVERCAA